jgi:hypothetical protein
LSVPKLMRIGNSRSLDKPDRGSKLAIFGKGTKKGISPIISVFSVFREAGRWTGVRVLRQWSPSFVSNWTYPLFSPSQHRASGKHPVVDQGLGRPCWHGHTRPDENRLAQ